MFRLVQLVVPRVAMPLEVLATVWLLTRVTVLVTVLRVTPLSTTTLVFVLMVLCITLRSLYLILIPVMKGVAVWVVLTVWCMLLVVLTRPLPSTIVLESLQWRRRLLFRCMVLCLKRCTLGAAPWA